MRKTIPWPVFVSCLLVVVAAACGGGSASPGDSTAPSPGPSSGSADEASSSAAQQSKPKRSAGPSGAWAPLPELPETEQEQAPEREPPSIESVADARKALARGFYEATEKALEELTGGDEAGRARLVLGRLKLQTGRYAEAVSAAKKAAQQQELRTRAGTLEGEALRAQGKLDRAKQAFEQVVDDDGAHRARVMLGRLLAQRGQRSKAEQMFYRLIRAYNDETIDMDDGEGLAYVAMAARGLRAYKDANDAFRQSTRADEDRVETQLEWARMFMEKYDTGHAEESVRHALERNPNHPEAHALLARIRIDQAFDFQAASKLLEQALQVNPNLVMAHVTRAGMALRDRDIEAADGHLDRALSIDPADLEARSVRAAVRYMEGDEKGFKKAKRSVLDRNDKYSEMFTIIGEYADWEHRYPDMIEMGRKAIQIDPTDARARAMLGMNLLRMGEEEKGLEQLRKAWQRDRYNVRVYNTLNLYDDVIPEHYEDFEEGPFEFRMHKKERPLLERYVPRTLRRAYRDMKKRYGYTPEGPVRFELFANQQHFATRTTGLPRLGVQGVCFGKVVTALSPGGGPFNWGQITWHELAHVFHIQMSENRVPRWFTEGLAEYEASIARPEWERHLDHVLQDAIEDGDLPKLALLNRAFTHAKSPQDMMTAYYAASQVVMYIVERFGFDPVVEMLKLWKKDLPTPKVVRRALGVDIDQLDRDFRAHTRERLAERGGNFEVDFAQYTDLQALRDEAKKSPNDPDARAAFAAGLLIAGKGKQAQATAQNVVDNAPKHPLANFLLGRIALAKKAPDQARKHFRRILEAGKDGYELRLMLARVALGQKDADAARKSLRAATKLDAQRAEAWQGLAMLEGKTGHTERQIEALHHLVRLDAHDRKAIRTLLGLLTKREQWREVVEVGEMALFGDPLNPATHRRLGEGYLHTDKPDKALYEFDSALRAGPKEKGPIHVARARALKALGRGEQAAEAGQKAIEADPEMRPRVREVLGELP